MVFTALSLLASAATLLGAEGNPAGGDAATKSQSPLPRYKLEVGQELIYEGSSRFHYENGSHGTKDRTTFWVTRLNPEGSWHVVAHNENTFLQSFGKQEKQLAPEHKRE